MRPLDFEILKKVSNPFFFYLELSLLANRYSKSYEGHIRDVMLEL